MTGDQVPLLERDPELTAFAVRAAMAVEGQGSVLVVRGPAGTGKSRLLAEMRSSGLALGMHVLAARGSVSEQELELGVAHQLLSPLLPLEAADQWPDALESAKERMAAFGALFGLAAAAAEREPLLLCVDDLVLADEASQGALAFLAHRIQAQRALLVVAARTGATVDAPPAVAEVLEDPDAVQLRPRPLSPEAVTRIARAHLDVVPAPEFTAVLHALTRGLPGAVAQALDRFDASGLAPTADAIGPLREMTGGSDYGAAAGPSAGSLRDAALARARDLWFAGEPAPAARVLTEAAAHVGDEPGAAFAIEAELQLLGRLALHVRARDPQRLRDLARALPRDDPGVRVTLAAAALDGALRGEPADGVATLAEVAWAGGRMLADEGARSPAVHAVAAVLVLAERDQAAQGVLDAVVAAARRAGQAGPEALAYCLRSRLAIIRGDVEDAERMARMALEVSSEPSARLVHSAAVGCLAVVRGLASGTVGSAQDLLAVTAREAPPAGAPMADILLFARGMMLLEAGNAGEALEDLLECGRRQEARSIQNPAALRWRSAAGLALARLEQPRRARELAVRELELARRFGAPRSLSRVLVTCGAVLRGPESLELLREGVALADLHCQAPAQAAALLELGAALRRAGLRVEAREHLQRARRLAEGARVARIAERATEELIVAGARPRRPQASGPGALTNRERRVADLAAAGTSNRRIADELYVTVKTVEMHLSNAYRKLGISSRSQLEAALGTDQA